MPGWHARLIGIVAAVETDRGSSVGGTAHEFSDRKSFELSLQNPRSGLPFVGADWFLRNGLVIVATSTGDEATIVGANGTEAKNLFLVQQWRQCKADWRVKRNIACVVWLNGRRCPG